MWQTPVTSHHNTPGQAQAKQQVSEYSTYQSRSEPEASGIRNKSCNALSSLQLTFQLTEVLIDAGGVLNVRGQLMWMETHSRHVLPAKQTQRCVPFAQQLWRSVPSRSNNFVQCYFNLPITHVKHFVRAFQIYLEDKLSGLRDERSSFRIPNGKKISLFCNTSRLALRST